MPVSSGHDQVCLLGADKLQEFGCNRTSGALPDFIHHSDTVAHEVISDLNCEILLVFGSRIFFADFDNQDLLGCPQKKSVAYRAPAF